MELELRSSAAQVRVTVKEQLPAPFQWRMNSAHATHERGRSSEGGDAWCSRWRRNAARCCHEDGRRQSMNRAPRKELLVAYPDLS